jgi:hypothetical protein
MNVNGKDLIITKQLVTAVLSVILNSIAGRKEILSFPFGGLHQGGFLAKRWGYAENLCQSDESPSSLISRNVHLFLYQMERYMQICKKE